MFKPYKTLPGYIVVFYVWQVKKKNIKVELFLKKIIRFRFVCCRKVTSPSLTSSTLKELFIGRAYRKKKEKLLRVLFYSFQLNTHISKIAIFVLPLLGGYTAFSG